MQDLPSPAWRRAAGCSRSPRCKISSVGGFRPCGISGFESARNLSCREGPANSHTIPISYISNIYTNSTWGREGRRGRRGRKAAHTEGGRWHSPDQKHGVTSRRGFFLFWFVFFLPLSFILNFTRCIYVKILHAKEHF